MGAEGGKGVGPVVVELGAWARVGVSSRIEDYGCGCARVWLVWARVGARPDGTEELRTYPEHDRAGAIAFLLALAPWMLTHRRIPTQDECCRLEDIAGCIEDDGPPVDREPVASGPVSTNRDVARCTSLVLGASEEIVDRVAMAYAFGRALDGREFAGLALDDEDDRQRAALALSAWWTSSRDVECVREGLAMLQRGESLEGFRLDSWLVSVARLAGLRHAEVSR
jgi:hypothetical protein